MKVWYINLDRRKDRREAILKNFEEMEVPQGDIYRFRGIDRDQFSSAANIVKLAADLGFPEFEKYLETGDQLMYIGYNLSYWCALLDIANQDEIVLLMEDDYFLTEPYAQIDDSFKFMPPQFGVQIGMLGYGWHSENRSFSEFRPCWPVSNNSVWQFGVPQRGTCANIFTPAGASFLLKVCKQYPTKTVETVMRDIVSTCPRVVSRKPKYIAIKESPAVGESDVMNEAGAVFERNYEMARSMGTVDFSGEDH